MIRKYTLLCYYCKIQYNKTKRTHKQNQIVVGVVGSSYKCREKPEAVMAIGLQLGNKAQENHTTA